ncbi:hypothetical protein [Streptomyces sp. NPDC048603]|uniref:hypothetical protein n=1 Tax=Streptomyces sp. NPDC048603 TaxID=3365577 RepID=UPI003715DE19
MDRHFTRPVRRRARTGTEARGGTAAQDAHWPGERRTAVLAAGLLVLSLLAVDAVAGSASWPRAVLWTGLGMLLYAVLLPPLVRVSPGRLTARKLFVERSVRTDALVSVRWSEGVAQRMVLKDAEGHRVEIDPGVLVRNPALWHRFDADARTSVRQGSLMCGGTALRQLAARIDREAARSVFRVSGLG